MIRFTRRPNSADSSRNAPIRSVKRLTPSSQTNLSISVNFFSDEKAKKNAVVKRHERFDASQIDGPFVSVFLNKKQEISRAFTLADRWKVTVDGNRPGMNERGRAFLSNLRNFFPCATGGTSRFIYFFFVKLFARNQLSSRLHLSNFRLQSDIFSAILVGVKAESLGIKSHRGDLTVRFK